MKKLNLALAVASALGATAANAAVVSEFANGVLVPHAVHQGSIAETTAVGLVSSCAGTVYWTFFDVNSVHLADDEFTMTANDQYGFTWFNESGNGFTGMEGYLTFVIDTNVDARVGALEVSDRPCLAANAFYVNTNAPGVSGDVTYIPAVPLQTKNPDPGLVAVGQPHGGDFGPADAAGVYVPNLTLKDGNTVVNLAAGANHGDLVYLRYFIDGAPTNNVYDGTNTRMYVWTAQDITGRYTVNIYDDNQDRRSLNFNFPNAELNVLDPETLLGRPNNFLDGFVLFDLSTPDYLATTAGPRAAPAYAPGTISYIDAAGALAPYNGPASYGDGLLSWSVVTSPLYEASQTIVNPIQLRESPDDNGNGVGLENQSRYRLTTLTQP